MSEPIFKWGPRQIRLSDVDASELPKVVKITHGQYMKVGVTKSKHPENLHQELLLHSVQTNKKILAHALKTSHAGKLGLSDVELKLSIPTTYRGWFEVMSEDGRTMRPLLSVQELARNVNETCLVREPIKGYQSDENNQLHFQKEKIIPAGDRLKIVENKAISIPGKLRKMKFLHCIDKKQEHVYLPHDTKCAFSLIANKSGMTSGVFTIDTLVNNFRFPVTARIVHGPVPSALKHTKFSGILRLVSSETSDTAFFMPLERKEKMIPISTAFPLRMRLADNADDYMSSNDIQEVHARCSHMVSSYLRSVHVLVNVPDPGNYKSLRTDSLSEPQSPTGLEKKRVVDVMFEEVDDLYGYVREGGTPPENRLERITGIDSNDWEEPIYEYIDKYQKHDEEDNGIVSKAPVENIARATTIQDSDGFKAVAIHRVSDVKASPSPGSGSPASGSSPKMNSPHSSPHMTSPLQMARVPPHVPAPLHVVAPVTQLRDKNGRVVKTKVYHNDLVAYAKPKSTHSAGSRSGGSSGEKHSKDSKDKLSSAGSKDSPRSGDHKVTVKRKSMKNMYL